MKSQVLLTVWCNISGGAGGEIWATTGAPLALLQVEIEFTSKLKKYECTSDVVRIGSEWSHLSSE